jgi:hypothetical protein
MRWLGVGGHFIEWHGKPIRSVKTGFARAALLAGLPGVTPHTLRHMAATWLMQRGVPVWEAAGFLGMSPEMLGQTYGHHHQDYLRNAANKIGTKPDALVVSLEEAKKRRVEKQNIYKKTGWAGQDSNLQPDRYERPALTVELPAPAGLDRGRILPWAAGPWCRSRISTVQPNEKNSRQTPRSFRMDFGITPGSAH